MKKSKGSRRPQRKRGDSSSLRAAEAGVAPSVKEQRYLDVVIAVLLVSFGIYQAVQFWGYAPMPQPDSPYFVKVGHELLSFQVPTTFKRAPVVGVLQALLSYVVGGAHPDLSAGWLLNSLLHPLNALLLWLVGRRLIGRTADFLAVVLMLNPWAIMRVTETIAETPLLFFALLTIYLMLRESNWCYVSGAAASLVRYELTGLIVAALVVDMIRLSGRRARWKAAGRAGLALTPLGLWLLGTALTWKPGVSHYLYHYKLEQEYHISSYLRWIWYTSVMPLFEFGRGGDGSAGGWWTLSQVLTVLSFGSGAVYALVKRHWKVLGILVFFILYLLAHFGRFSNKDRYYAPLYWIVILLCGLGWQGWWRLIPAQKSWVRPLALVLQGAVLVVAVVWAGTLIVKLPTYCPAAAAFPWLALAILAVVTGGRCYVHRGRFLLKHLALGVLMFFMVASNQFVLAERMASKRGHDFEFVQMMDWYRAEAQPGEKLATTLPTPLRLLAPKMGKDVLIHTGSLDSADPAAFTRDCLKKNVTYPTWDSRIGLVPKNSYYQMWHIEKIRMLTQPRSFMLWEQDPAEAGRRRPVGYFKFLTRVGRTGGYYPRYINIFRLYRPEAAPEQAGLSYLYNKAQDKLFVLKSGS